jgi:hypothetical protein
MESIMKAARLFPYAVAIAIGVTSFSPAHAEDWKVTGEFGWFGVGKAYQIEKGHVYWVGEFTGTFFNDKGKGSLFDRAGVKCPAYFDLTSTTRKLRPEGIV